MAKVTIILSCFNGEIYLAKAIQSVISQSYQGWELIFINDGSTDKSLDIAKDFMLLDARIKVASKENGGYVSARIYGLQYASPQSEYYLFFDSDDILHPLMLSTLVEQLENNPNVGAVFCNHRLIDENDMDLGLPAYGVRVIPTTFWMKPIKDEIKLTPFISIFCWSSRMIEPMTLIRKKAYSASKGWDIRFGKGKGNIGEGILLFSEIALSWDVLYINTPLYSYRKHSKQFTASTTLNSKAGKKVINIWCEIIKEKNKYAKDIRGAIICYKHRSFAYSSSRSLKHSLRYNPINFIILIFSICWHWLLSLQLLFFKDTRVFK